MRRLIILFLASLLMTAAGAQRISHNFKNASLSDALSLIAKHSRTYKINFIFNELEDFSVTTTVKDKNVLDAVRQVIGFYPMLLTIDGDNVFIECTQKEYRKLGGTLTDSHGHPVPYANISLLNERDTSFITGGVSNEAGRFVIPCEADRVLMRISCVGYKTVTRLVSTTEIGNIPMISNSVALKGVTVKSQRPSTVLTDGGFSTQVAGTLLGTLGTAADVLEQVPRVVFTEGSPKVFGKGTPAIYVNKRKITGTEELKRIASSDIKSINVITSPGAQYSAETEAVIRIRTKKPQGSGLSGNAYSSFSHTEKNSWYESGSFNYRTGGLDVFGAMSYNNSYFGQKQESRMKLTQDGDGFMKDTSMDSGSKTDMLSAEGGFNFQMSDDSSFGLTYNFMSTLPGQRARTAQDYSVEKHGNTVDNVKYLSDSKGSKIGPNHEIDGYYEGKIGRATINADGTALWRNLLYEDRIAEESTSTGTGHTHTTGRSFGRMYAGKVEVSLPAGQSADITAGTELSYSDNKISSESDNTQIKPSEDRIKETNMALFAQMSVRIGRFKLNAGMRYERVRSDYYSSGKRQDGLSRSYGNLFPNISVRFSKGGFQTALSMSVRTRRAAYWQMSGYVRYDDAYTFETENSKLRPTTTYSTDWDMAFRWLTFSASYRYHRRPILSTMARYGSSSDIVMLLNENVGRHQVVDLSLSAQPSVGAWHPSVSIYFEQQFIDAGDYGITRSMQSPLLMISANNNVALPRNWQIGLRYNFSTAYDNGFYHRASSSSLNFNVQKSLLGNRLTLRLQATDILGDMPYERTLYGRIGEFLTKGNVMTRGVSVSVSYMFNSTRKKYKGTGAGRSEKARM